MTLDLGTPWARGSVQDPDRSLLRAAIPDGWPIPVSVSKHVHGAAIVVAAGTELASRAWRGRAAGGGVSGAAREADATAWRR